MERSSCFPSLRAFRGSRLFLPQVLERSRIPSRKASCTNLHGRWFMSLLYLMFGRKSIGSDGLIRLSPDDDPQQGLHRRRIHVVRCRDITHRLSDGAVLGLVWRVLRHPNLSTASVNQPGSTAHPNIDHDRVLVSGNSPGKGISLGTAQTVKPVRHTTVGSDHVRPQTARSNALRVLERLSLVVSPSDAGAERGHNAARHFHVPLGTNHAEGSRERVSLSVPCVSSLIIETGSGCEEGEQTIRDGARSGHAYIVTDDMA